MVVCGIGHRYLRLPGRPALLMATHPSTPVLMRMVRDKLRELGATEVVAAAVPGFPALVGLTALAVNIPVTVLTPYPDYVKSMPPKYCGWFDILCDGASRIELVSSRRRGAKRDQLIKAIKVSIDRSDQVVKFWNGRADASCAETVQYSWQKRRLGHNLWHDFVRNATGSTL